MKTLDKIILGLALVWELGGCGEAKKVEDKKDEVEQVYVLPDAYTLPETCAEVVSMGIAGRWANVNYVSCKETDGKYGVYVFHAKYEKRGFGDSIFKGYEWERVKKYQHAEKK